MILPTHLRTHGGLWYCDAYSHERQAWRIYRVDRFLDVKAAPSSPPPLEHPLPIPTREHPSFPEIRIHLTARGALRLEHDADLGPRLQRQDNGEGWLILHWRTKEYDWLVRILLSLGTDAEILEPEELRTRVKLEAKKLPVTTRNYDRRLSPFSCYTLPQIDTQATSAGSVWSCQPGTRINGRDQTLPTEGCKGNQIVLRNTREDDDDNARVSARRRGSSRNCLRDWTAGGTGRSRDRYSHCRPVCGNFGRCQRVGTDYQWPCTG